MNLNQFPVCLFVLSRLVCGDVKGQFAKIFKKVGNLNKKNGPFEVNTMKFFFVF